MNSKIRVRFAPSPTGPLHIGGVRTALYNYLFARRHKGVMILRIEDTDQNRFVPGAEDYIIDSLAWCGITFDEGIREGGTYGPYRQSDRKEIYRKYADELVSGGHAYYAFDTPEELDKLRKEYESRKEIFTYDVSTRKGMRNSLTLGETEVQALISEGTPYVIRFKIPEGEELHFQDIIRGEIVVNTNTLDDKVLFKSDGMPTYHLANIVDDHLMEISHVIRGEEWLPSLPLHVLLYRSFGWEAPLFAHLPLILKPEGSGKLSKRDGDRLGFPVFPTEWKDPFTGDIASGYRESGYFPEAFINMLALLGWNPGTEQELLSMDELISLFSLERVGKSGSRFDPEKAKWFNHQYLQRHTDKELALLYNNILKEKGIETDLGFTERIVGMIKERSDFVKDFWGQSHFFFQGPESYDEGALKKGWKENTTTLLSEFKNVLAEVKPFDAESIKAAAGQFTTNKGIGLGQVMLPLRICIVGSTFGPDLATILEIIGVDEAIKRIDRALGLI